MTIIMRSALEYWGRPNIPPQLHSIVDGKIRTWADVMEDRRKWQAERLRRKRDNFIRRPRLFKLWAAYYDMDLMGGWQAFLETYGPPTWDQRVWIDRDARGMKPRLMALFPLVLPLGSEAEQWSAWKPLFARHYARGNHHGRPRGSVIVRWDRGTQIDLYRRGKSQED